MRCPVCGAELVNGACVNAAHPWSRDAHRALAMDLPRPEHQVVPFPVRRGHFFPAVTVTEYEDGSVSVEWDWADSWSEGSDEEFDRVPTSDREIAGVADDLIGVHLPTGHRWAVLNVGV